MKQKRKVLAILVAFAMLIGGIPVGVFDVHAAQGHCNNSDDCNVCTVADMINDLPDKESIDINNAAAVTEQIHAIDRIKGDLSDAEYEEMLGLVEHGNDGSGYGMDVPTRYMDAVEAVTGLKAGGSLAVSKKYSVGDEELNWSKTNAEIRIESMDANDGFSPLNVKLADINDSSLSGFYSADADGWTNTYMLPVGTYKVTETGYNAVTEDGDKLSTVAKYDVEGEESSDYAVVTVKDGEMSSIEIMNSYAPVYVTANFWTTNKADGWGVAKLLKEDGSELEINSDVSEHVDSVYPQLNLRLTNVNDPNDVIDGVTCTGSSHKLMTRATYAISQPDKATNKYKLQSDDMQIRVLGEEQFAWVSGEDGAVESDNWGTIWLKVTAEYDNHTYKLDWPEGEQGRSCDIIITADGEQATVLSMGPEPLGKGNSVTVKRLKYNPDGTEIEWHAKGDAVGSDFWNLYRIKSEIIEDDVTTVVLDHVTYMVPFDVPEGVECFVAEGYSEDNVIWRSSDEAAGPTLKVGSGYSIYYTAVPKGYTKDSQTISINQNNELRYNGNDLDEDVSDGFNDVVIAPETAENYSIECTKSENGEVTADAEVMYEGGTVSLTVKPDENYKLETLEVKDVDGNSVDVKDNKFEMPGSDVTVTATFAALIPVDKDGDGKPDEYVDPDDVVDGVYTDPETGNKYEDTDGDGILDDGIEYIPDQDGDNKPEPDTDGDSIYEGTADDKTYIPDQDGDGKPEVDDDNDQIFDNENDDKHYVPDGNGGFTEYLLTYEVSEDVLIWTLGGTEDVTYTVDGPVEKFEGLKLDGAVVDDENYSYVSGSTIITLKASYLNSLSVGEYPLVAEYVDGSGKTTLKIVAATTPGGGEGSGDNVAPGGDADGTTGADSDKDSASDTGDNASPFIWFMIMVAAAGAAVVTRRVRA